MELTIEGEQWHGGRVLDSRLKGCRFESHRCHCVVSLSKTLYSRPLIAQDKLFHRQNAVRNFLIPST